ncbi:MAG TPA: QueT transporter family protein [Candidatus Anaerotruncus excrementipullorum]|uniref:QueT transporter family protein n=1 Tax=Candidatus Anaerotruncus excrementipullorum TaxID=2838465 RepID=A0A9D2B6G7_9FIRM|nr:QueT transporter family protein [Candidatus Anaerotruncus excrementipullorum]
MQKHPLVTTRSLTLAAMLAAVYTVVSFALLPLSFGIVQVRVAEALTLLPVFSPAAIWGVTVGCLLTNLIGVATGAVLPMDIFVGTAATLLAALFTRKLRGFTWRGLPVVSVLPPVVFNGIFVGAELTWMFTPDTPALFWMNAASVAVGELAACGVLGLALVWCIQRAGLGRAMA